MHINKEHVRFTKAQLDLLEQAFPAVVLGPQTTEAQMRFYFGQRSVLALVRELAEGTSKKIPNETSPDIPTPR